METVRAINMGRSSRRTRKTGSYQGASTSKDGDGFRFNPSDIVSESLGDGATVANSQTGIPVAGKWPLELHTYYEALETSGRWL